ncbi:MAG: ABC transporter permease [Methanolinea sp.]|nr:ABC transporter permease [Methanolinea sp.]
MNGRNVLLVAAKDLRSLGNERTIVLAILLQLFVALFSSFLMVGLTSMYDPSALARFPGTQYPVGYVGQEGDLARLLRESGQFSVYTMDLANAVGALKERKLSAVVYAPSIPPDSPGPVKVTLYVLQNDIQSTIVSVKLKEVFLAYEEFLRTVRASRLDVVPETLEFPADRSGPGFYEFIYGLLVPLLLMMPAIISAALVIDLVCEEYQHHTLETLLSTPMTMPEVVWGKVAACLLLVPLQAGTWIALLSLNRIAIENIPLVMAHVVTTSLVLVLFATLVALFYRERTSAQFVFSTAVVVIMLAALAFPGNPLNAIAQLSTGTVAPPQFAALLLALAACIVLALATHAAARKLQGRGGE